ncbi:MAG: formylglycine-generating enzyme family protein [Candidatus Hydrogenedentes bacterium]|nr:formylglycine-generating enzyme family protein [Candidatus Hydrogenedentota bacterium]
MCPRPLPRISCPCHPFFLFAVLLLCALTVFGEAAPLRLSPHYIAAPLPDQSREEWLQALSDYRASIRATLDRSIYDRPDLQWASSAFTCHFTFMYDRSFYSPDTGAYTLDSFLGDGQREFGGYDAIVLWQGYPRLGFDDRNQVDMYRDMPGGLDGLRDLVRGARARGVKVFIDYNPWDTGTHRENMPDQDIVAALIRDIEADGVFLDTMTGAGPEWRNALDAAKPGVVLAPEIHPEIAQLSVCNLSWAQWLDDPVPPGMLHLKWIEPRHMQHQIRRWDTSHAREIETAFFNGSGVLVWENVFGTYNPWPDADRASWLRASTLLKRYAPVFTNDSWGPFYPTLQPGLYAHRWQGDAIDVYTLYAPGKTLTDVPALAVPLQEGDTVWDAWNGEPARVSPSDAAQPPVVTSSNVGQPPSAAASAHIISTVAPLGCVAVIHANATPESRAAWTRPPTPPSPNPQRNARRSVIDPTPIATTPYTPANKVPDGMVLVPVSAFRMTITHQRRECGCYPDPGTPPGKWRDNLWGSPFDGTITHNFGDVSVRAFYIDETEVSNAQYAAFLAATHYTPKHRENFLKHWHGAAPPADIAELPVVYVDIDDARAYARWAGKRLPTEAEWQLASQGTDGRKWPWGNEFDPRFCVCDAKGPMPVRALPEGRSPYGCYHMAGNVWEWTESERDDGHTRFAMVRGGSWFTAKGSGWYAPSGPQPCDSHAKFIRMWPGLDRCATIGFRCVKDIQPQ